MSDSIYKIIELVGTSEVSWEDAVKTCIDKAAQTLKELRVAEVTRMDVKIRDNQIVKYRVRVKLSFKYMKE